jgi:hypothetical protein
MAHRRSEKLGLGSSQKECEMGLQRENLGHAAFCVHVEKIYLKK